MYATFTGYLGAGSWHSSNEFSIIFLEAAAHSSHKCVALHFACLANMCARVSVSVRVGMCICMGASVSTGVSLRICSYVGWCGKQRYYNWRRFSVVVVPSNLQKLPQRAGGVARGQEGGGQTA